MDDDKIRKLFRTTLHEAHCPPMDSLVRPMLDLAAEQIRSVYWRVEPRVTDNQIFIGDHVIVTIDVGETYYKETYYKVTGGQRIVEVRGEDALARAVADALRYAAPRLADADKAARLIRVGS